MTIDEEEARRKYGVQLTKDEKEGKGVHAKSTKEGAKGTKVFFISKGPDGDG